MLSKRDLENARLLRSLVKSVDALRREYTQSSIRGNRVLAATTRAETRHVGKARRDWKAAQTKLLAVVANMDLSSVPKNQHPLVKAWKELALYAEAYINALDRKGSTSIREATENAFLIAALHDLRDALSGMLDAYWGEGDGGEPPECVRRSLAAIGRAEREKE